MDKLTTDEEKTTDWIKAALLRKDKESLELINNIVANVTKLQQLDTNKSSYTNWALIILLLFFPSFGSSSFNNYCGSNITKQEDNGNTSN